MYFVCFRYTCSQGSSFSMFCYITDGDNAHFSNLLASIYSIIHLYVEPLEYFPQPLTVACLYFSQRVFIIDTAYVCFTYT